MKNRMIAIFETLKNNKKGVIIAIVSLVVVVAAVLCFVFIKPGADTKKPSDNNPNISSEHTSSTEENNEREENSSKVVASEEENSSDDTPSINNSTVNKKPTSTSSKTESSNGNNSNSSPSSSASNKKDYLDTSSLTGTEADVGKVVGYSSMFNKEITVTRVIEGVNGIGCKYIRTYYSDGSVTSVAECEYCHKMPCPDGGGEKCSSYNVKNDTSITCPDCGLPYGNGYNGTCYNTIDWENGGKTTCHNYD